MSIPPRSPRPPRVPLVVVLALVATLCIGALPRAQAQPDTRLDWWRDARFGMFIHWGLYAVPAGEWGGKTSHAEWIRTTAQIPREEYDLFKPRFNPTEFDARAWVRLAKQAGMKYVTITTKHHDGFALFDTKTTDWCVRETPFKRDIMKEIADACREEGLRICWYYSIMDWHHPDYLPRRDWETWPTDGADFDRYVEYMKAQLKELLTNYGPIGVLWFDGQWEGNWTDERGEDLYAYVRSLQPDIIINSRVGRAGGAWGLDAESAMLGDYATPEQTIPDEVPPDLDWETCMTMNGHWGFNAADHDFKSTTDLVRKLADIASKGGNFLLNVGPDADGEIPPESIQRLQEIGAWMDVNADSIRGTRAGPLAHLPWGRSTARTLKGGSTRIYLHVFDKPADNRLVVPGLLNTPSKAFLLSAPDASLDVRRNLDDVVITLPSAASDPHDLVVVLDVAGAADVMTPPVITAPATIFIDKIDVAISSPQRSVQIRYTTDGTEPTARSPVAPEHLTITATSIISARSYRGTRPVGPIARLALTRVDPVPATPVSDAVEGLSFIYYQTGGPGPNDGVDMKSVAELDALTPIKTGRTQGFDLSIRNREKDWGVRYTAYLHVPTTGVYRFAVGSDDGSRLWIGDRLVVENDLPHSYKVESGDIALAAGFHPITVAFFENWGGFDLKVFWTPPGGAREPIPLDKLWTTP